MIRIKSANDTGCAAAELQGLIRNSSTLMHRLLSVSVDVCAAVAFSLQSKTAVTV